MNSTLGVNLNSIPLELCERPQWVCWRMETRKGKPTKVPYSPASNKKADTTDPATWSSFDTAHSVFEEGQYTGIGYVFSTDDPYCGVDLDDCINGTGRPVPEAQEIIDTFATYCEVSPSGNGVKLIGKAVKPGAKCRTKKVEGFKEIEIYDHDRYFAVTGALLDGCLPTINECQAQLDGLYTQLWTKPKASNTSGTTQNNTNSRALPTDDLLSIAFKSKKNGNAIESLWNGDTSGHGGDASAADLALCNHLAFYFNRDPVAIDRMFRQSDLMRDKWDEKRGDTTYGAMTIAKAVAETNNTFTPDDGFCGSAWEWELQAYAKDPAAILSPYAEQLAKFFAKKDGKDATAGKKQAPPQTSELLITNAATVKPTPVEWLWEYKLVAGGMNMLVGMPDVGKGVFTMDLAARVSTGTPWPICGMDRPSECRQGRVLIFSCEDDKANTLKPRLMAAGADCSHVDIADGVLRNADGEREGFDIARDVRLLEKYRAAHPDFRLLIIDPLDSYLGGKTDTNIGNKVREVMGPLDYWCKESGVTCIIVHHVNKSATTVALDKVSGARSFGAQPRSVWVVGRDPNDGKRVIISPAKLNLCSREKRKAMSYTFAPTPFDIAGFTDDQKPPCIAWDAEASDVTDSELIEGKKRTAKDDAKEWLLAILKPGALKASTVRERADEAGHTWATIKRAKTDAGIKSQPVYRDGENGTKVIDHHVWLIP